MKAVLKHLLEIFPLKPGKIQLRSAFMISQLVQSSTSQKKFALLDAGDAPLL